MRAETAWTLFRATGAVEYYLLYRTLRDGAAPQARREPPCPAALGVSAFAPCRGHPTGESPKNQT